MTALFVSVRSARADRAGFTMVELLIAVVVAGILIGIGSARVSEYLSRQGAANARNSFVYMAVRARSAAIERGRMVRLEIDPGADRAWIVTNRSGAGDTLETMYYSGEYRANVTITGDEVLTVCYSPRGFAIQSCTSINSATEVGFARGTGSAAAEVRPLGQVVAQ